MNTIAFRAGNYGSPEEKTLFRCAFDPEKGFRMLEARSGLLNPSYVLEHPEKPMLYTVEETAEGAVCAWRLGAEEPTLQKKLATGGADPCHYGTERDPGAD